MKIIANAYFDNITDISHEYLKANNINAIILDIDNTIVADGSFTVPDNISEWLKNIALPIFFLSNGKEKRVKFFAVKFGAKYIFKAKKPIPENYYKAAKKLGILTNNTAVIGDQLLSDILGGNLAGCFTIKVPPIDPKSDPLSVKIKRIAERIFQ